MDPQAQQGMDRDEMLKHRREGGRWLRTMRERAGLSQRELAQAIGSDYYSFISQLESGKGRIPVAQVELWARALKVPRSEFAKGVLRYYDPITYDMLFGDEEDETLQPFSARPMLAALDGVALERATAAPAPETSAGEQDEAERNEPRATRSAESNNELLARISRLEAILMMRGAKALTSKHRGSGAIRSDLLAFVRSAIERRANR